MVPFIHHGPPPWGFGWSPQPPSLMPCFLPKSHLSGLPRRHRGRAQTTTAGHDFALKYYPLARERRLATHSIHVADFWLLFFSSCPPPDQICLARELGATGGKGNGWHHDYRDHRAHVQPTSGGPESWAGRHLSRPELASWAHLAPWLSIAGRSPCRAACCGWFSSPRLPPFIGKDIGSL